METNFIEELARIAYVTYAAHQNWKNYNGGPIPDWDNLRPDIHDAWVSSTDAVIAEFKERNK